MHVRHDQRICCSAVSERNTIFIEVIDRDGCNAVVDVSELRYITCIRTICAERKELRFIKCAALKVYEDGFVFDGGILFGESYRDRTGTLSDIVREFQGNVSRHVKSGGTTSHTEPRKVACKDRRGILRIFVTCSRPGICGCEASERNVPDASSQSDGVSKTRNVVCGEICPFSGFTDFDAADIFGLILEIHVFYQNRIDTAGTDACRLWFRKPERYVYGVR